LINLLKGDVDKVMAVKPLVGFGLAFIGGGLFWMMIQDTITRNIGKYVLNTADKYYVVSKLVWDALPFIVLIVGVVVLIFGGLSSSTDTGGD
jgi:hypothetical protein